MPSSTGWRNRRDKRRTDLTPLGEVIEGLLRERPFARGLPIGRLAVSWERVVGPRLAGETAPVSLEGGTLAVAASTGPWGAQARFLAEEIRNQANRELGSEQVKRVRIVVRPEPRKPL